MTISGLPGNTGRNAPLTILTSLTMNHIRANVAENIMAALGMDNEDCIRASSYHGAKFQGVKFTRKGQRTWGNIDVRVRASGRFNVWVHPHDNIRPDKHLNLTGAGLEDLFIELADI